MKFSPKNHKILAYLTVEDQHTLACASGVYIAGPMKGRVMQNCRAFFRVSLDLRNLGIRCINPAEYDLANGVDLCQELSPEDRPTILREDLILMLRDCKAVVALPEWEKSEGARLELSVAAVCGLPIYLVETDYGHEYTTQGILHEDWTLRRAPAIREERLKEVFSYEFP